MTLTGLTQGPHQFRVQARLGSAVSLPATRTWNIELPAPTTPAPVAKTAALRFASVVSFPSSKRCVSRRLLRLRLRKPSGQRIVYAEVRLRGRKTRTLSGGKLALPIDLRGLPKGSFKVRLKVVLSSGKVLQGSKTYKTCAAKKKAKKKR